MKIYFDSEPFDRLRLLCSQLEFLPYFTGGNPCTPVVVSVYALGYKGTFRDTVLSAAHEQLVV